MVTQTNKTQMNDEHNHAVGPTKFPPHPEKIYTFCHKNNTLFYFKLLQEKSCLFITEYTDKEQEWILKWLIYAILRADSWKSLGVGQPE